MTNAASALGWGLFCACSWTWCIGLFLPAEMVTRYGPLGFVVFAVPNVIGCALMGYVVRSTAASRAMVDRHGTAMAVFSLVTIAFHMYFVGWVFDALVPLAPVPSVLIAAAVLIIGTLAARLGQATWVVASVVVYAVSLLAFVKLLGLGEVQLIVPDPIRPVGDVLWLSPVVAAGFICSPYLDATFHRARQCATTPHAFGVFGITFGVMLVVSLFIWLRGDAPMPAIVIAHLLAQSTFTVGAHARELGELGPTRCPVRRRAWLLIALGAALIYPALSGWFDAGSFGTNMYLRFLVAYGLLAPAYVLVFVGPRRRVALTHAALVRWGVVVVLMMPLYELAFVGTGAWLMAVPAGVAGGWLLTRTGELRE